MNDHSFLRPGVARRIFFANSLAAVLILLVSPLSAEGQDTSSAPAELAVHIDFPGGSGEVLEIHQQQRRIRIVPSSHPGRGWACWWYFHVTGVQPGEILTIEVGEPPWATPERAAVKEPGGSWSQTRLGQTVGDRMVYRHQVQSEEVWFAWGPPFSEKDAAELVAWAAQQCERAEVFELCRTREGRSVPALRLTAEDPDESFGIWIQARQHAWESGSSWVCRGLVEWLVSDEPTARRLRSIANITVVPVMDIDNVAIGAGGKDQTPHDHNRDWSEAPHWSSVSAAMQQILDQDRAGRFDIFVDLHNPGPRSRNPFFYIAPPELLSETATQNLKRFLDMARQEMTGPLAFLGQTYESGRNYDERWQFISKNWVSLHCQPHIVSVTLETAWNTPHSTAEGYRVVGKQLGKTLERYLRVDPRSGKSDTAE